MITYNTNKKNKNYCLNCNEYGHIGRYCSKGIISNGLISFNIIDFNIKDLENLIIFINENFYKINDDVDEQINENIKFLMIQRKHSLGFIEFMRGKYMSNNLESINNLVKQMNTEEIEDIKKTEFDELWGKLWNCVGVGDLKYKNEYMLSKQKFYEMKINFDINNNFEKSTYLFNEWGFPKGRREKNENNYECAIREFFEETEMDKDDIIITNSIEIKEELVGTNGLNYIHNYYLVYNVNNNIIKPNNVEVGNMKLFTIKGCVENIRPYHYNKLSIIKKLYNLIDKYLKEK